MYRTSITFDCIANASCFSREAEKILGSKVEAILKGPKLIVLVRDNDSTSDAIEKLADQCAGVLGCWDDSNPSDNRRNTLERTSISDLPQP